MRGATRRNSNARMTQHRFQSTLLMRGATSGLRRQSASKRNFNPRSSCEERRGTGSSRQIFLHFNPRSSCEERHVLHYRRADWHHFNPRSSCEERLEIPHSTPGRTEFQSTLLMRGATEKRSRGREGDVISIHAPHARSDTTDTNKRKCGDISIHAPHARSDDDVNAISADVVEFQSTLLMRGATLRRHRHKERQRHFNPRSSCEERPCVHFAIRASCDFNPRSSCEERRCTLGRSSRRLTNFNPRSSCEERR